MILRRIELRSFRQFVETDITFDEGITAIVGPNGAGKTTLLEAVKFALYGIPCRGKKDDLPNMYHGGKMSVAIEFELGGDLYRCERSQTNAALFNVLDGDSQRIAFAITGVNNHAVKLLGLTAEQFSNSYFTEQKQLDFLNFGAKDKQQQQVSQMLGIEVLADASKMAKEKSKASGAALEQMQSMLESKENLVADIKAKEEACNSARASLVKAEKDVAELRLQIAQLEPKSKLAEEWKDLAIRIRERADLGRQLEKDLEAINEALKVAVTEAKERSDLESLSVEFAAVAQKHAEMSNLRGALSEKEKWVHDRDSKLKEIAEIESKIDPDLDNAILGIEDNVANAISAKAAAVTAVSKLQHAWSVSRSESSTTLKHLQQALTNADVELEQVRQAEAKGICPTCEQPLPDGHAPRSATLGSLITGIKKEITYTEQLIKGLEDEPAELNEANKSVADCEGLLANLLAEMQNAKTAAAVQRGNLERIDSLKATVAALQKRIDSVPTSFDRAAYDQLGLQLAALEPKRNRFIELSGAPDRLKRVERQHEEKSKRFEEEKRRQIYDKKRMEEIDLDQAAAEKVINDFRQAQGSFPHVEKRVADCRAILEVAQAAVKDAEQRLIKWQENAERIEGHRHDRDLYREVGDAMHELRTELNREIRPTLEAFAADSLAQITANRYTRISIDDSFRATLIDGEYSKNVISGGEEDVLALSLRIALSRYIQEKSGLPLTMLVLDEVFGSLDPERRANVLEMFSGLRGMFPQIILISHVDGLADHADRVLRVNYDQVTQKSTVGETAQEAVSLL